MLSIFPDRREKQIALCGYFETGYKKNLTVIRPESAPTIHQSAAAWADVLCDRTVPFWLKVAGVGKGYRNATAKRVRLVHCSDSPPSWTPSCTTYARDRLELASALYLLVFSSSPTSNRSLCLYPNPLGGSWMAFETETALGRRQKKPPNSLILVCPPPLLPPSSQPCAPWARSGKTFTLSPIDLPSWTVSFICRLI